MRNTCLLQVRSWILFFLILMIPVFTGAADVPFEAYGRLPSLENVAISPSGSYMALVKVVNKERVVYVLSLPDAKVKGLCKAGKSKLREIIWADDEHVLLVVSTTSGPPRGFSGSKSEYSMLLVYDITENNIYNPFNKDTSIKEMFLNNIIGYPSIRRINDETIIFVEGLHVQDYTLPALFNINLTTNKLKLVKHGTRKTLGWLVDNNGGIMGEQTYDSKSGHWIIYTRKEGDMVAAAEGKAEIEYPTISGFSPEGDSIWVRSIGDEDPIWNPIPFESGKMGDPLKETRGLGGLAADPYTGKIIGGYSLTGDDSIIFFDVERQKVWEAVKEKLPDEHVNIVSASRDYKKLILLIDGTVHGYAYYYMDLELLKSSRIGDVYDGLPGIAEVKPIKYAAADGMIIPGYLTLPMEREPKNLPLVVLPHGGPASRDSGHFDWWAQALASQGYAVLQSNFRGSRLNWEFMSAGFGEWGRKMQTDLSDGVRYLVKEGIVDPDRVSIVGASYGGYAALAGVTLDAGVYNCAISVAGLSDLRSFKKFAANNSLSGDLIVRYWDRYFGASGSRDPIYKTLSPLEHAEKVKVPVMLIHGKDDTVVPYKQSKIMVKALKRARKPVEFITLTQEDHWLSRSDTRLEMLKESIRFLKEHNPPF